MEALLGRETRGHKDLDLLVLLDDLPALWDLFHEHGFTLQWVWRDNRWVAGAGAGERWPAAFVVADGHGRELDVHLIDIGPDGTIVQHYDSPWPIPDAIDGQGSIAGAMVPCVSKQTHLSMHTGYPLPDGHQRDLELL